MPDPFSADRTAEMLLWYFEEPARYLAEGRRRGAPLLDSEVVLKLALGRKVEFAVPPGDAKAVAALRAAAAAYVRHLFFRPDATPYQILGLAPGAPPEAIKESFRLLMQLVHPDRQDGRAEWPDSFAAQANRAYGVLRDQDARARFDRDAEARAAMARALHRAAAASAASKMPVVQRPRPRFGRGGLLPRVRLPEWLTAGFGGYAREHPATVAFSVLIGVAALTVAAMAWEAKEGWLTREALQEREPAAPPALAKPFETAAASVAGARKPAPSAVGGADPISPRAPDPPAAIAGARAPAPAGDRPARDASEPSVVMDAAGPARPAAATRALAAAAGSADRVAPAPAALPESAVPTTRIASRLALAPARAATKNEHDPAPEPVPAPPVAGGGMASVQTVTASANAPAGGGMASVQAVTASANAPAGSGTASVQAVPVSPNAPAGAAPSVPAVPPLPARADPVAMVAPDPAPGALSSPPGTAEIEALFAAFVETYERGRVDAFAALFDDGADTNHGRGRAVIRSEYDELFRQSQWRKMQLTRINWKRAGDRTLAKGEITVRIGWRDGREVEQRLAVDMELVRRDGRAVFAKLSQQPKNP